MLLNNKSGQFRLLVAARVCLWIAGGITGVALPLALFQRTQSAALTSALAAIEVLPYLAVGLVAGAVADRMRTRTVAIASCLICAVSSGSVPLADALGSLTTVHLFVAAFTAGIALVFFDGAMFAALPAIVSQDKVSAAFASLTAVSTVIALVAPMVGGFLAGVITPELTLAVDAALATLAAAVFGVLREPDRVRSATATSIGADIREGLRFIAGHRLIRSLTALGIGNSISEGLLSGLLVGTIVTVHGASDDGPELGFAYSALAIGALVGSRLIGVFQKRAQVRTVTATGLVVAAAGVALWSQQPSFALGIVALMIYQVGATTVILNGITARAHATPAYLQGRVNTTARMFAWGGQPVGALLAAGLVTVWGVAPTHLIAVVLLLVTAVLALRALRPAALEAAVAP